jgi:hypothetical protein
MSIIVNDKFFEVGSERWKLGGDFKSVLRDMSPLTAAEKGNELTRAGLSTAPDAR